MVSVIALVLPLLFRGEEWFQKASQTQLCAKLITIITLHWDKDLRA